VSARNAFFVHDAQAASSGSILNGGTGRYEAFAPTSYKNVYGTGSDLGWSNSLQLVDVSGTAGAMNCNVAYKGLSISPSAGNATTTLNFTFFTAVFLPNQSTTPTLPSKWVGTMKIDCNKPFLGLVNLTYRRTTATIKPFVSSQELLAGGGTEVYFPDTRASGNSALPSWASSVIVMNLGTSSINVTLQGFNQGNTTGTPNWTLTGLSELTVPAGSGTGIFLSNPAYAATIPSSFVGSVKATAGGATIHGAVNYTYIGTETGGDTWGVYSAIVK
jgi:hypothetical protein